MALDKFTSWRKKSRKWERWPGGGCKCQPKLNQNQRGGIGGRGKIKGSIAQGMFAVPLLGAAGRWLHWSAISTCVMFSMYICVWCFPRTCALCSSLLAALHQRRSVQVSEWAAGLLQG